MLNWR